MHYLYLSLIRSKELSCFSKELCVPLLIWGPRDEITNPGSISSNRCTVWYFLSRVLRRYGIKFTYIENCKINDEIFEDGFVTFIETARIVCF